jgi:hypothetical protein
MSASVRKRFWVEVGAAALSLALLAITLITDEWIELVFSVSPDGGSGLLEWALVAVAAGLTATFLLLARLEWRRAALRTT